jgi:glycosyltransferase involved in cell wall biosynthesis
VSASDLFELRRMFSAWWPARLRRGVFAAPPYVGYLERPRAHELPGAGGTLEVAGWIFSPGAPIRGLSARAGDGPEVALQLGLPRPDLAAAFTDEPRASRAGFGGAVPLPPGDQPVELRIFARGLVDRRAPCFVQTVRLPPPPASTWEQSRAERLRQPFLGWVQAAAFAHPRVQAAGPAIFDALCDQLRRRGEPIDALERRLSEPLPRAAPRSRPAPSARRRLLVVAAMFPSTAHGGGLRLFDILSHLGERHDIDLYATYREDQDRESLLQLLPSLRAVRLWPDDVLDARDLLRWAERRGVTAGHYHAIHFEWPQSAAIMTQVAPLGGRSLFTFMECTTRAATDALDAALARGEHPGEAARHFAIAFGRERQALAACDSAIAVTPEDAAFVARAFDVSSPQVIPTCLSDSQVLQRLTSDDDAPPPHAAFIGYFDHYPNQDAMTWYLREVHPLVRARVPDYRLEVIGRGDTSRLRALVAGDPSVQLVGAVDDLMAALTRARIGVVPVRSGAGIRGKVNQHAAAARPVVTTSLGASGLPYRDGQEILLADDAPRFADAVVRLLCDDLLWRSMGRGAHARALAELRWPPWIARLEALHAE